MNMNVKRKNGKIDKYFEDMMKRTYVGSVGWVDAAPALQNITKKTNIPTNSLYRRNDRVDVYPLLHLSARNRVRRKQSLYLYLLFSFLLTFHLCLLSHECSSAEHYTKHLEPV